MYVYAYINKSKKIYSMTTSQYFFKLVLKQFLMVHILQCLCWWQNRLKLKFCFQKVRRRLNDKVVCRTAERCSRSKSWNEYVIFCLGSNLSGDTCVVTIIFIIVVDFLTTCVSMMHQFECLFFSASYKNCTNFIIQSEGWFTNYVCESRFAKFGKIANFIV